MTLCLSNWRYLRLSQQYYFALCHEQILSLNNWISQSFHLYLGKFENISYFPRIYDVYISKSKWLSTAGICFFLLRKAFWFVLRAQVSIRSHCKASSCQVTLEECLFTYLHPLKLILNLLQCECVLHILCYMKIALWSPCFLWPSLPGVDLFL